MAMRSARLTILETRLPSLTMNTTRTAQRPMPTEPSPIMTMVREVSWPPNPRRAKTVPSPRSITSMTATEISRA